MIVTMLLAAGAMSVVARAEHSFPDLPFDAFESPDTCSADNWGVVSQTRKPFRKTFTEDIHDGCAASFANMKPMSQTLENAMANWYKDNAAFDKFEGIDLVPENHHMFKAGSPWGSKLNTKERPKGSFKAATCDNVLEDGSTWTVTRIGPFFTTGGYDWVQIGWDNLWDLREKFQRFPDGIYVTDQFSGPVTRDGERIGNPPIHVHHIHVGPSPGVRQRSEQYECLVNENGCYDPTRVFEHHGDYQCFPEDGGLDCLVESTPDGYGKLLTFELGLEGDLNDARAAGSSVMEWYYELGMHWIPKNDPSGKQYPPTKAMSFHNFAGPGDFVVGKQSTYIFTFQAPTDQESIFWYTGRMHHTGKMLRNKQHAHNSIFTESIFVDATPEELGLTEKNHLFPSKPYIPLKTKETGFVNNIAVKKFVLEQLKANRKRYLASDDESAAGGSRMNASARSSSRGLEAYNTYAKRSGPPKVICHTVQSMERVDGYDWDRKEPTCCVPWDFNDGQVFTVLAFNSQLKSSMPNEKTPPPRTFPGHIGYWLSFDTKETPEKSHYSIIQYTDSPENQFDGEDLKAGNLRLKIYLYGGTPTEDIWFLQVGSAILLFYVKHIVLGSLVIVAAAAGLVFVVRSHQAKRRSSLCNIQISAPEHEL